MNQKQQNQDLEEDETYIEKDPKSIQKDIFPGSNFGGGGEKVSSPELP